MRTKKKNWSAKLSTAKKRHDDYLAARTKTFRENKRQQRRIADMVAVAAARTRKRGRTPKQSRAARRSLSLKAPKHLSLFDNGDATLAYCKDVRNHASRPNAEVYLDFDEVETFTTDALLLIRAIIDECGKKGAVRHPAVFSGNLPRTESVATEFKASGFFKGIARPPKNLPEPAGTFFKESKTVVHANVAAALSKFALHHATIGQDHAITSFRNLVELMNNTHEHARPVEDTSRSRSRTGTKTPQPSSRWFASVYCRERVAYFTFLDFGIGIMGSAPVRRARLRLQRLLRIPISNTDLLAEVFSGKAGSSTGKPGRGRGLPGMRRDAKESRLSRLRVLTSNVTGTVADLKFITIEGSFHGTAFHWQVKREG